MFIDRPCGVYSPAVIHGAQEESETMGHCIGARCPQEIMLTCVRWHAEVLMRELDATAPHIQETPACVRARAMRMVVAKTVSVTSARDVANG